LDCELLLLTCPVLFLTELVRLPITRRCPASRLAIHQLLKQLAYCLTVTIDTESIRAGSCKRPDTNLFLSLLLCELTRKRTSAKATESHSQGSLLSDLDWDTLEEAFWEYEDIEIANENKTRKSARTTTVEEVAGTIRPPPSPVPLTEPVLTTVICLFELVPTGIVSLFDCLNDLLREPNSNTLERTVHTERIVHILFLALAVWSKSASSEECSTVLEPVIRLFPILVSIDSDRKCLPNRLDTTGLLFGVMYQLLQRTGSLPSIGSTLTDSLLQIDETLHSKAASGFKHFSDWVSWSLLRRSIQNYAPTRIVKWESEVIVGHLKRLLEWDVILESVNDDLDLTILIVSHLPRKKFQDGLI
uniref:DUF4704 domain-containing protein n=1 Tax=Echinostoma caproni TaxID=27848 RepID=A0A183B7W5_9TREM